MRTVRWSSLTITSRRISSQQINKHNHRFEASTCSVCSEILSSCSQILHVDYQLNKKKNKVYRVRFLFPNHFMSMQLVTKRSNESANQNILNEKSHNSWSGSWTSVDGLRGRRRGNGRKITNENNLESRVEREEKKQSHIMTKENILIHSIIAALVEFFFLSFLLEFQIYCAESLLPAMWIPRRRTSIMMIK